MRAYVGLSLWGVMVIALMAAPSVAVAELTSEDLDYQGAFAFPPGEDWSYAGLALTYYPAGDPDNADSYSGALFATGNAQQDRVGALAIPAPVITESFDSLPRAPVIEPLTDITEGRIETFTECGYREVRNVDGLAYIPRLDKLFWNLRDWYNTEACDNDSLGFSDPDLSRAQGVWHIGPRPSSDDRFHNAKTCDYLFTAPQEFADQYLGGRTLIAGNHREGGALGGSSGPTLYAVSLPHPEAPPAGGSALDALALVYYRFRLGCAWAESGVVPVPEPDACDFPGYRAFDNWSGGAWIESGDEGAILIFGRKGVGDNCYGTQAECSDDPCNMYKGYHAYPYEPRILFYDPADIQAVAAGSREPWTVLPYATDNPAEVMFNPECGVLGPAAYDSKEGILYVVEQDADGSGGSAVHVWQVEGGESGDDSHGWETVSGTVTYQSQPLCAMILANGQYMFTDAADGRFQLEVPLDAHGEITLFAFCDGLAPYRVTLSPDQATDQAIEMAADPGSQTMAIAYEIAPADSPPGWWRISGTVTDGQGAPLWVMVLANGQYMFTEPEVGEFDLTVPLDSDGWITLFGFCDGLAPYKTVAAP